jgi:phosphoribosylamine--glycine ligase
MLPRFGGDLALLLDAVARGRLAEYGPLAFTTLSSMTVVVAAPNYPSTPRLGDEVKMSEMDGVTTIAFVAGLVRRGDLLLSSGGRVLAVTALGDNLASARASVYRALDNIDYPAGYYRRDIGAREMLRAHSDPPRG